MRFKVFWIPTYCTTLTLLLLPGTSLVAASEESSAIEMETVTVTANKIKEDVQDVPQAITVVDEAELKEKEITTVRELIDEVPDMSFFDNGAMGDNVNFRGLNASTFTNNNPVVVFIDGVPKADGYDLEASLANAERVEVLRGPQGTLYGKDAIGAVINIVTKTPTNQWQSGVTAEYGSNNYLFNTFNSSGAIIKDTLFAGINGRIEQDDGWITNNYPGRDKDANKKRDWNIGGNLLYKPTDHLSARLNFASDYSEKNFIDGYAKPAGATLDSFSRDEGKQISFDMPTSTDIRSDAQSLHLSYRFDAARLEAITTHKRAEVEGDYDADFSDNADWLGLTQYNYTDIDTITQEIRLASPAAATYRWVGGIYYDRERREQGPFGMEFPTGYGNYVMDSVSTGKNQTQAVFGQVMVPFASRYELTLGGRYQKIDKEMNLAMYYYAAGGATGNPIYTIDDKTTWYAFLPKAALSYTISDRFTAYTSYSKGYMPGGYNYFASAGALDDNRFEPAKSTNYEIGLKASLKKLTVNASIFRMDIRDIHVYKSVGSIWMSDNADKVHSQGVEIDFNYRPLAGLKITGALGLIDSEYDDYDNGTKRYDGERIEQTPSYTARLGIAYSHPQGWYGRFDVRGQGETYFFDNANSTMTKADAYGVADMKIGYLFTDLEIYGYVENLTDEEYINSFMSSSTVAFATFGEGRKFGLGARFSF